VLLPTDPKNVDWATELAKRNPKLKAADLSAWGYYPIQVELDEFIKSGGSVYCLKQSLFE